MNANTANEATQGQPKIETPYLLYNGLADALQKLIDDTKETIRRLGGEVR
jgi:hypothetical protein